MAGLVQTFKDMWSAPEDEYESEDYGETKYDREEFEDISSGSSRKQSSVRDYVKQSEKNHANNKVMNIHATAQLHVALFKPERFGEDTTAIADELIKMHTVILNLEKTNKDVSNRIIDFLSGVAYANNGKIKRIATSTYIITPYNVDLTGADVLDELELENNSVYF